MKKSIKEILSENFPKTKAICVLTRLDFSYLIKTEATWAWRISPERASDYKQVIVVSLGSKENARGDYFIADIDRINSRRELKKLYRENKTFPKLDKLIAEEEHLYKKEGGSPDFAKINLVNDNEHDVRLVIFFDKNTVKKRRLYEEFRGLSNPAFYIGSNLIRPIDTYDEESDLTDEELGWIEDFLPDVSDKIPNNNLIKEVDDEKEKTDLKISELKISNFINFGSFEETFSPNINLIIGENNTGKTSLIKFLYAVAKSSENYIKQKKLYDRSFKSILSRNMQEVFQSSYEGIGTVVSKNTSATLEALVKFSENKNSEIKFSFGETTKKEIPNVAISENFEAKSKAGFNAIFVPAKEVLSLTEPIKRTFNDYIKGFDTTYYDLADAVLGVFMKPDRIEPKHRNIVNHIENDIIHGKIIFDENLRELFYINKAGQKFEMTMTAEGVKQVGTISLLLNRGKLNSNTILFLDEPDNNLNPKTITKFVAILTDLAKTGVQIFLSSHNYFITNRLQISAKQNKDLNYKVFSLYKNDEKINIETKDLKIGMPDFNPINDEAIKLYEDDLLIDLNS